MASKNILANSPSIIYQQGGVSGGLVVTTWAQVQKFLAARQGACTVYIDDSLTGGVGCIVPSASGITDVSRVEFRPIRQDETNFSTLVVQNGATLKNLYKVTGTVFLILECTGAVPCLDFDYSAGFFGAAIPICFFDNHAILSDNPVGGNTNPAVIVPVGQELEFNFTNTAGVFYAGPSSLVQATGIFNVLATDAELQNIAGGVVSPAWVNGAGSCAIGYDSATVKQSGGIPTSAAGTNAQIQLDTHEVALTFLASAANVLGALQSARFLPPTGIVHIHIEGFGGTGGGGGGQGGAAAPGVGGGGSGGAQYQYGSFDHNLAHPLNINIAGAAPGGAAGAAGGGAGGNGSSGGVGEASDPITNVSLFVLQGSSGGQGGAGGQPGRGGATYAGTGTGVFIPNITDAGGPPYGSGFVAAGGVGGGPGLPGAAGQRTLAAASVTGGGSFWGPGAGGTSAGGEGGGGGGGGDGIFAPAGPGGNGAAVGSNPGGGSAPNSGAGVGGGSGGAGVADPGGVGAPGSIGLVKLSLTVY